MKYLLFILFFFCVLITPKKYNKIINPVYLFVMLWFFILFLAGLRIYNLYSYSLMVERIIVIGVFSFAIGYLCVILLFANEKKISYKKNIVNFSFRYKLLYIVGLTCIVYYFKYFYDAIIMILNGNSFEVIRRYVQDQSSSYNIKSQFEITVSNFWIYPCAMSLEVITACDFWLCKRDKLLFVINFIIILMRMVSDGGRTPLVDFAIYMFFAYIISRTSKNKNGIKEKKDKILIYSFAMISFVALLFISISRSSSTLSRQVYFYFSMSPVLLTVWIEKLSDVHLTKGLTAINGLPFSVLYFLEQVFKIKNEYVSKMSEIIMPNYNFIALTNSSWEPIALGSQGDIRANAYVSCFLFLYADAKILGVIVGCFIYGAVTTYIYIYVINNKDIKSIIVYLFFYQGLFFSFIRFPFIKHYYVVALIMLLFLFVKKQKGFYMERFSIFNYRCL